MVVYLMRMPAVEAALGLDRATIYRHIAAGLLPPPVHATASKSAWPSDEVTAIVGARIEGMNDEAIRALVHTLVAARKGAMKRLAA